MLSHHYIAMSAFIYCECCEKFSRVYNSEKENNIILEHKENVFEQVNQLVTRNSNNKTKYSPYLSFRSLALALFMFYAVSSFLKSLLFYFQLFGFSTLLRWFIVCTFTNARVPRALYFTAKFHYPLNKISLSFKQNTLHEHSISKTISETFKGGNKARIK